MQARPRLTATTLSTTLLLAACGGESPPASTGMDTAAGPATAQAAESGPAPQADQGLGEPLDDPSRYYGVYADPARPDRAWFIAEARRPVWAEQAPEVPPGHLALGAMFGDVAPWHLKTLSQTEFVQARVPDAQPEPVAIAVELDADGRAIAFRFTSGDLGTGGRLERVRDLPEDW